MGEVASHRGVVRYFARQREVGNPRRGSFDNHHHKATIPHTALE
jgi:hypothetical protein